MMGVKVSCTVQVSGTHKTTKKGRKKYAPATTVAAAPATIAAAAVAVDCRGVSRGEVIQVSACMNE